MTSRKEALALGLKHYSTGVPCARGHIALRFASSAGCVECSEHHRKEWRAKNPERTRELRRNWALMNPEKEKQSHTASNAKWWSGAKTSVNARRRELRKVCPDKFRECSRRSAAKHRDRVRARLEQWRLKNPERWKAILRAADRRRRARMNNAPGSHTAADVAELLKSQKNKCVYCRTPFGKKYHVDHIVPIARGGSDDRSNLQILCAPCNQSKSARDPIVFAQSRGMLL